MCPPGAHSEWTRSRRCDRSSRGKLVGADPRLESRIRYTCDVALRRYLSAAIIAVCIVVPLVEAFDTWDQTLRDDNDTEATVVIAALCVGFALTVAASAVTRWIRPLPAVARVQRGPVIRTAWTAGHMVSRISNDSS